MTPRVTVVDYGVGNLLSISRALAKVGAEAELTGSAERILRADRLLLPGVGAFGACAAALRQAELVEPVVAFAARGNPFLGICVGMQLLFDESREFGAHAGLGIVPGTVDLIPHGNGMPSRKVPHIGWSPLICPPERETWLATPLADLEPGASAAYFVHSYSAHPKQAEHRLADVDYQGYRVCAAVQNDNVCGFQFHPEKSGEVGLSILTHFSGVR